jgi:hypothetical protein
MKPHKMKKLYKFLMLITNNDHNEWDDDINFDISFWLINTGMLIIGTIVFILRASPEWVPFLFMEYLWTWECIRNNR